MSKQNFDIRNITLNKSDWDKPNKYFLMEKDVILSKECLDLWVNVLKSPQYKLFSALVKSNKWSDEVLKYLILWQNKQFFSVKINNSDEFLFDEITANPDVNEKTGNMSLKIKLDKLKIILLETDWTIFTYRWSDWLERKYFDSIERDVYGNTEFRFNGKDYRMTKAEQDKAKSFLGNFFNIFKK